MTPEKKLITTDVNTTDFEQPPAPSVSDAAKALDEAIGEMTKGTPGLWCFVPISVGADEQPCGRPRLKAHEVCCPEHWKLVPKELRREMNEANKHRSERRRQRESVLVADKIIAYLTAQLVQLPPVQPIMRDEPRIIRPGEVARPDSPNVINPKIILPR